MAKKKEEKKEFDKGMLNLPKIDVSYQKLKKQIKKGYAPKEWDAIYELLSTRVKESFEKMPENTFFYEEIEALYSGVSH